MPYSDSFDTLSRVSQSEQCARWKQ